MKRTVWPCRTTLIAMPDGTDRNMRPRAGTRLPHLTTASEASKQSDKSLPIIPHLQFTERQGPWTRDYILCPLTFLIGLSHEWMALAAGRKPYSLRPDKAQVDAQQRRPALRGMVHRGRTYMPAAHANPAQGLRRRRPHSPKPASIAGPGILHAYRNVHRMAAGPAHDILIQGPTAIAEAPPERYPNLYSSTVMCIAIIVAIGIIPPRGNFFSGVLSMLLAANLLPWLGAERHSAMPAAVLSAIMTTVIVPGIYLQMPRAGSCPCGQPSRQERKE